jgi:HPr kinase/phosphorylase
MYCVENIFRTHKEKLNLDLITGKDGLKKEVQTPEVHRPGLSLAGFLKGYERKRSLIFGHVEISYLFELENSVRANRLRAILSEETPFAVVSKKLTIPDELYEICQKLDLPLFLSTFSTIELLHRLTLLLAEEFAPHLSCHGTFVEVFGVGILIQGDSSVGKSEAALGLIERGHRLISDDVVTVKKKEDDKLEGFGQELTRYHMEVRGIGIINVANLFGVDCVSEKKNLDIVVKLEVWDDSHFYDRVGLEEKKINFLGTQVPYHILPVKPGRDVVLLLETIALNHRLKKMGYHSAKEFHVKLLKKMAAQEAC